MRRRTLHPKVIEPTEKFFILTIDRLQFAIPMGVVLRVLSPSQSIEWNNQSIPTLDLRHLMSDTSNDIQDSPTHLPIHSSTNLPNPQPYTLIIASSNTDKPWGLQIPTLPNLLTLPTQAIKDFPNPETDRSVPYLSDRFITLSAGELTQTLFLINLSHLEASIGLA